MPPGKRRKKRKSKRKSDKAGSTPLWPIFLFGILFISGAGLFVWWKWGFPDSIELKEKLIPGLITPTTADSESLDPLAPTRPEMPPQRSLSPLKDEEPGGDTELNNPQDEMDATQALRPSIEPFRSPRIVANIFEAQLVLVSQGFSPGSMDGVLGSQTRAALEKFQLLSGLTVTGILDSPTKSLLILKKNPLTSYEVTSQDIERIMIVPSTWLGKSQVDRLDYESVLELVAEKHASHPAFIRQLNPGIDWDHIYPGALVKVPNLTLPDPSGKADRIRIDLSDRVLEVYDKAGRLMAFFPCSIAKKVEKRPRGELRITGIAENPNYRFNPEIFTESPEARSIGRPLMIPPGPNNPVGSAWISLDLPAYGIHGTPVPELVGRTESHGCFRLANWNAEYLIQVVETGTLVIVEP